MSSSNSKVYQALQRAILEGAYAVGSKLPPERELAAQYGVSRFVIREAVAKLSQQGLLETRPQSGNYVRDFYAEASLDLLVVQTLSKFDPQSVGALLDLSDLIAVYAARLAAANVCAKDLEKLKIILAEKAGSVATEVAAIDFRFQAEVMRLSANQFLTSVFNSIRPLYCSHAEALYAQEGVARMSLRYNLKLLAALADNDAEESAAAMQAMLSYARSRMDGVLGAQSQL